MFGIMLKYRITKSSNAAENAYTFFPDSDCEYHVQL